MGERLMTFVIGLDQALVEPNNEIIYAAGYGEPLVQGDEMEGTPTAFPLLFSEYPSGEPLIKNPGSGRTVRAILLRQRGMSAFLAMLAWVDALAARGEPIPVLIIPQFPGA